MSIADTTEVNSNVDFITFDQINEKPSKKQKQKRQGGFQSLKLERGLLRGILRVGYRVPTPIQRRAIPPALKGLDVVAMARTGSGKTLAFLIPMLNLLKAHSTKIGVRGLILAPSRDIALQTYKFARDIGHFLDIRICTLVGGESMDEQFSALASNPDLIIGTPGRIMHIIKDAEFSLQAVEMCVFDEADRMFEMGFSEQINEIFRALGESEKRQILLFSATLPTRIVNFCSGILSPSHEVIRLDTEVKISPQLEVTFINIKSEDRDAALLHLLNSVIPKQQQVIVFVATRHHVEYLTELLSTIEFVPNENENESDKTAEQKVLRGVVGVYGSMDQTARKIAMAKFRKGDFRVLIVTDVAARGLDLPLLDNVVHYHPASSPRAFIHRSGRTARAGKAGCAYSLITSEELPYMLEIYLFLGAKPMNTVPGNISYREYMDKILGDESSERSIFYGNLPSSLLVVEIEEVKRAIAKSADLPNMERTCLNGMKLFIKTRNPPSADAVKRAKLLEQNHLHPLFATNQAIIEHHNYIESLKTFRPSHTVFEEDRKNGIKSENKSKAQLAMEEKRLKDQAKIEAKKQKMEQQRTEQMHEAELAELAAAEEKEAMKRNRSNDDSVSSRGAKRIRIQTSFQDKNFFLSSVPSGRSFEDGLERKEEKQMLSNLAFDIAADEEDSVKRTISEKKWDRKRKKFVQVSGGLEMKKKFERNESGQQIAKKKNYYSEWKEKTKQEIGKVGTKEFGSAPKIINPAKSKWGNKNTNNSQNDNEEETHKSKPMKGKWAKDKTQNQSRNELRDFNQVKKMRKEKDKKAMLKHLKNRKGSKRVTQGKQNSKQFNKSGKVAKFSKPMKSFSGKGKGKGNGRHFSRR